MFYRKYPIHKLAKIYVGLEESPNPSLKFLTTINNNDFLEGFEWGDSFDISGEWGVGTWAGALYDSLRFLYLIWGGRPRSS